mmetsp:Transcript_13610/g.40551  ORF Transcript_13610/g.40551 Transcript_13610/m.40551 type:complete len:84 (-) Transcript_13610:242-493(-)
MQCRDAPGRMVDVSASVQQQSDCLYFAGSAHKQQRLHASFLATKAKLLVGIDTAVQQATNPVHVAAFAGVEPPALFVCTYELV